MDIEVLSVDRLRFSDGAPVRSASAVVSFGGGFLVVPDDATHAAWFREETVTAVRLLPPVAGHEVFDEVSGTKHLKPDFEAACQVTVDGAPAALIMGSGSSPARMRWSLLRLEHGEPRVVVADMTQVYSAVAAAMSIDADLLNMEGACTVEWCAAVVPPRASLGRPALRKHRHRPHHRAGCRARSARLGRRCGDQRSTLRPGRRGRRRAGCHRRRRIARWNSPRQCCG